MQPRYLVVGESNCGKSAFAERIADSLSRPSRYFATLESSENNRIRINRHRYQRRKICWDLYEMSGIFNEDLDVLINWLRGPGTVLIDGFAIALSRWQANNSSCLSYFHIIFEKLMCAECSWIIVDNIPLKQQNHAKSICCDQQSKSYLKYLLEIDGVISCVLL